MAVRIQLASNFQVVELTYDGWEEVDQLEVNEATDLVNFLGKQVQNDIKTKNDKKEETTKEPASEKQIKYAVSLGLDEETAKQMSKKEVWNYIQSKKK